jgi:hypothetical protein
MSDRISVDPEKFHRDGYLVIKNAFTEDEVAEYRENLLAIFESEDNSEDYFGDLLVNPATATFIDDGRLIEVTRQLLGGNPVYFGDSSAMYYTQDHNVCSFHKDNADRHDCDAPDWEGDYTVLRFGLYLQDHHRQGGGLMLRARSHKSVSRYRKLEVLNEEVFGWLNGRTRYVPAEIGDLIVWNLRTTHAGMGRFIRGPIHRPVTERTQRLIPTFMQSSVAESRVALFASYGLAGPHLDRYLSYLKTRTYMVDIWRDTPYAPELFEKFEIQRAELLDMHHEILSDLSSGRPVGEHTHWKPLPY